MKIAKIKIPYTPDKIEDQYVYPTDNEVKHLEKLIQQGKEKEFKDYVNSRVLPRELNPSYHPGLPTRDFLAQALTQSIKNRYPELEDMSQDKRVSFIKERAYPGLDEVKKAFNLSNEIKYGPSSFYNPTGMENAGEMQLRKQNRMHRDVTLDDIIHETGHSIDDIVRRYKYAQKFGGLVNMLSGAEKQSLDKFVEKKPKVKELLDAPLSDTTDRETEKPYKSISESPRLPNFEDYDWKKGEFGSDDIQSPIQKYEEVGGDHHLNRRPTSLDNFINFAKGDLKDVVKNEDKFSKLRKKLV